MSRIWGAGAAAVVAGMLFGVVPDADAGGRRLFWSETGVQLNDRPLPPGKRIWSRESGDQPDTGYWALLTPFTEAPLVEGLNTPGGVFVDVLNGHLYWVDSVTRQVGRSDLDGGGAQTLFIADGNPEAVAFDPGSGSVFITIFPETGIDIDVRNGKLYYAVAGAGQIRRKNFDGSDDDVTNSSLTAPASLTFEVWISPDATPGFNTVIEFGDDTP